MLCKMGKITKFLVITLTLCINLSIGFYDQKLAVVSYSYKFNIEETNNKSEKLSSRTVLGWYDDKSAPSSVTGLLYHINGSHDACEPIREAVSAGIRPWVALVRRGGCTFHTKMANCAEAGAGAVVMYNDRHGGLVRMLHSVNIVSVFVTRSDGGRLARVVNAHPHVMLNVTPGTGFNDDSLQAMWHQMSENNPTTDLRTVVSLVNTSTTLPCKTHEQLSSTTLSVEWLVGTVRRYTDLWWKVAVWDVKGAVMASDGLSIQKDSGKLVIEKLAIRLAGPYTCFVLDANGPSFTHVWLEVYAPPSKPEISGLEDPIIEGSLTEISCQSSNVKPRNITFDWLIIQRGVAKPIQSVLPANRIEQKVRTEVKLADGGYRVTESVRIRFGLAQNGLLLRCVVTHGVLVDEVVQEAISIRVVRLDLNSTISVHPKDTLGTKGSSVRLMCQLTGSNIAFTGSDVTLPQDNIMTDILMWSRVNAGPCEEEVIFHSRSLIAPDPQKYEVEGRFNLVVKNLTEQDGGQYICELLMSQQRFAATLKVMSNPVIYQPPSDLNVAVGRSVVLQCQTDLIHLHSDVFRWRRLSSTYPQPGEVIFQNFPLFVSDSKKFAIQGRFNLIIRNATINDEGVYICELVLQGLRYRANLKVVEYNDTIQTSRPVPIPNVTPSRMQSELTSSTLNPSGVENHKDREESLAEESLHVFDTISPSYTLPISTNHIATPILINEDYPHSSLHSHYGGKLMTSEALDLSTSSYVEHQAIRSEFNEGSGENEETVPITLLQPYPSDNRLTDETQVWQGEQISLSTAWTPVLDSSNIVNDHGGVDSVTDFFVEVKPTNTSLYDNSIKWTKTNDLQSTQAWIENDRELPITTQYDDLFSLRESDHSLAGRSTKIPDSLVSKPTAMVQERYESGSKSTTKMQTEHGQISESLIQKQSEYISDTDGSDNGRSDVESKTSGIHQADDQQSTVPPTAETSSSVDSTEQLYNVVQSTLVPSEVVLGTSNDPETVTEETSPEDK